MPPLLAAICSGLRPCKQYNRDSCIQEGACTHFRGVHFVHQTSQLLAISVMM